MLNSAAGLVITPTVTTTTGYSRLGVAMVPLEAGVVPSSAPPPSNGRRGVARAARATSTNNAGGGTPYQGSHT
jgi:hypothetical protein